MFRGVSKLKKFSWLASMSDLSNPPGAIMPAGHACSTSLPVVSAVLSPAKSVFIERKASRKRRIESYFASLKQHEKRVAPESVGRSDKVVSATVSTERIGDRALRLMAEAKGAPSKNLYGMPPDGLAARALQAAMRLTAEGLRT